MAHQGDLIASNIEEYLHQHENKGLMRLITCGSVDDGKSTLIGRLLYDSKMIFEDQLSAIEKDSKKVGTQGGELDLALLVDGLQSEREQGITIDVAYRFFSTDKRKFIIADTPGHEQYTRNMATGASTADLAIILIDARYGVQTQTRRHSYIVHLLGIKHIIVAINKMDLVDFSESRFNEIREEYTTLSKELGIENPIYVPMSALNGDNVVNASEQSPWYNGECLMEILDTLDISDKSDAKPFRFPVQWVNRPNLNFRGFAGTIASGSVKVGDEITVLPSGKTTRIKSIIPPMAENNLSLMGENSAIETLDEAYAPMAVTLTTEDEVDISRGDMIVHAEHLPRISNSLKVMIVWMADEPMSIGKNYHIKSATTVLGGSFDHINYKIDVNTYEKAIVEELHLNDIASCKLVLNRPIAADPYRLNRSTGSFIVIDRLSNSTVGAGMIVDVSRRDQDIVPSDHREYTQAEVELNRYIRNHFPEWGCKAI
ncbi:MAG: sulfate adenylyltransferase subunit CysN [Sulfuricurvum sp.]|uniref:sulfate adenylyltransferase subunit CysN n=1 Tax=Sulfuricurvum sp. TaxID=2025608 RepID=UPI00260BD81F|nr:sulfate adenylyltransferase subunit CysN [Sulfuricurvum sp.]MDD2828385.1 sulfate adenylyltransferase subunit CysN [Sulfuricurvum sp.]MDD4949390.1 sulfate adenylyltransferase subunit CysN [Sulfuricurvum sp.]